MVTMWPCRTGGPDRMATVWPLRPWASCRGICARRGHNVATAQKCRKRPRRERPAGHHRLSHWTCWRCLSSFCMVITCFVSCCFSLPVKFYRIVSYICCYAVALFASRGQYSSGLLLALCVWPPNTLLFYFILFYLREIADGPPWIQAGLILVLPPERMSEEKNRWLTFLSTGHSLLGSRFTQSRQKLCPQGSDLGRRSLAVNVSVQMLHSIWNKAKWNIF